MYCLRAAAKMNVFAVEGNQSTIVHLTGEQLSAHRFPWPPPDEQQGIVYRLDTDKADTEATRKKLMDQVDLLSERRQALITAAVTGDLEIPGVAA
jgi:type I restriction enzyme S subunit